jgi:D-glucosaminate-6-phosphate ammonia-lyase
MSWQNSRKSVLNYWNGIQRREFLKNSGLAAVLGFGGTLECAGATNKKIYSTYESLGVRPIINCWGTITVMGGSLVAPAVSKTMEEANKHFVFLDELMEKVSLRLAELTGAEGGIVTSGAAGALMLATAACVAGDDPEKMSKIPDLSGMKNEVLAHRLHRHGFERAMRNVGVSILECSSIADLRSKITDKTVMISLLGAAFDNPDSPKLEEFVEAGWEKNVPLLVDAAAERPDVPDRYIKAGVDLVAYSGGKCLRGPQSSGLLLGTKKLTWAAYLNTSPHNNLGRPMKVDKHEILGCLAALEWWIFERDHKGEWRQWEGWLKQISDAIAGIPSVRTSIVQPGRLNVTPNLAIEWDPQKTGLTYQQIHDQLLEGNPRIAIPANDKGLVVNPYMMEPGEAALVSQRLRQLFQEKA